MPLTRACACIHARTPPSAPLSLHAASIRLEAACDAYDGQGRAGNSCMQCEALLNGPSSLHPLFCTCARVRLCTDWCAGRFA
ncbi:hypothetical protein EON65_12850 [archaeon]|nr:MAG: hypothetical protein EON65_12850 [archaeon]